MADPKTEEKKVANPAAAGGAYKEPEAPATGVTPPATEPTIKDVTVDGFTFKLDTEKIDDVEVIEMAGQIEEGQTAKIIDFVKFLLGDDVYTDMKAYFVAKDGKFKLTTLMSVFEAIFENFDPKG